MGFDAIVNLMEPGERTFSGELLEDYTPLLEQYASKLNREVSVFRFPIKDLSVTTPKRMFEIIQWILALIQGGKKVYVHCWGGVGRTGTVIGCYLIENQMASTENVIQTIDYLKRTTPIKDRRSPETDEQIDFILDWPVLRVTN
jgi:protein-tyrosine phosphatase